MRQPMHLARKRLFATWKNCLTTDESIRLAGSAVEILEGRRLAFEFSICPGMTALRSIRDRFASKLTLTAQNLIWDSPLTFTGETSAEELCEIGCKYVIIGHSERRLHLGETDAMVARKITTALAHSLTPVVCIGEYYEDYVADETRKRIDTQLDAVFSAWDGAEDLVIAYEPAWAISTSAQRLRCDPALAQKRHTYIRGKVRHRHGGSVAEGLTILFGGSMNGSNAGEYFVSDEIDGGLVGSGSQRSESLLRLIDAATGAWMGEPNA